MNMLDLINARVELNRLEEDLKTAYENSNKRLRELLCDGKDKHIGYVETGDDDLFQWYTDGTYSYYLASDDCLDLQALYIGNPLAEHLLPGEYNVCKQMYDLFHSRRLELDKHITLLEKREKMKAKYGVDIDLVDLA